MNLILQADDESLYFAYVKGDQKSFDILYKRYYEHIWKMIFNRIRNRDRTDEAVQDTFLKLHRSKDKYKKDTNLRAWIFKIAWNTASDINRMTHRRKPLILIDDFEEYQDYFLTNEEVGSALIKEEDKNHVKNTLSKLSEKQKN